MNLTKISISIANNKCESDFNCKQNEYCDDKTLKCVIGCRLYGSCDHNMHCDEDKRICETGCNDDSDCYTDEMCQVNLKICVFRMSARPFSFNDAEHHIIMPEILKLATVQVLARLENHENSNN